MQKLNGQPILTGGVVVSHLGCSASQKLGITLSHKRIQCFNHCSVIEVSRIKVEMGLATNFAFNNV